MFQGIYLVDTAKSLTFVTLLVKTLREMTHFKYLFATLLMMLVAVTANAQAEEEKPVRYPQIFFGVQGGAQVTPTDYSNRKLITPTASFSVGSFFTPIVGARLHMNGLWNKGGYSDTEEDFKYKYKYLTFNIDAMLNLVTLIGKKNTYPLNVYLIGGIGLNYSWDNGDAYAHQDKLLLASDKGRLSHNARIGTMLEYNISKHVGINLEVTANTLKDRYNSKKSNKGDWQITTQLGVVYKFSAKKAK